jgi:hypothetical protein
MEGGRVGGGKEKDGAEKGGWVERRAGTEKCLEIEGRGNVLEAPEGVGTRLRVPKAKRRQRE